MRVKLNQLIVLRGIDDYRYHQRDERLPKMVAQRPNKGRTDRYHPDYEKAFSAVAQFHP
ncbi:hypothetical protein ACFXNG_004472 [Salmonella enterica]